MRSAWIAPVVRKDESGVDRSYWLKRLFKGSRYSKNYIIGIERSTMLLSFFRTSPQFYTDLLLPLPRSLLRGKG